MSADSLGALGRRVAATEDQGETAMGGPSHVALTLTDNAEEVLRLVRHHADPAAARDTAALCTTMARVVVALPRLADALDIDLEQAIIDHVRRLEQAGQGRSGRRR